MPTLAFLAAVGIALIALLCVADATLERSSPVIPTSDRIGLPERWHSGTIQILTSAPAPAPDITSPPVIAAQPKPGPDFLKIGPAARAARAEAPPKNRRVARSDSTKSLGRQIFYFGSIGRRDGTRQEAFLSKPDRNEIAARLRKLPGDFLFALINATAILVIVAAILALAIMVRIDNLAEE